MVRIRRYCGPYLYEIDNGRLRQYCGQYRYELNGKYIRQYCGPIMYEIEGYLNNDELMMLVAVLFA